MSRLVISASAELYSFAPLPARLYVCVFLGRSIREGEIPVSHNARVVRHCSSESCTLEVVCQLGGNFHLRLNTISRPIANKYREGKVKRTLERELEASETAKTEANETSC